MVMMVISMGATGLPPRRQNHMGSTLLVRLTVITIKDILKIDMFTIIIIFISLWITEIIRMR